MKAFCTFLIGSLMFTVGLMRGETTTDTWKLIESESFAIRFHAVSSLDRERQDRIKYLILILDGNAMPDVKDSAAKLLGDYRAAEGVKSLIANFALDVRPRVMNGMLADDYVQPVTIALIRIGNSSIPAVLRYLEQTDDPRMRRLSLKVLSSIDNDKDITRLRLEKALKAEKDSQKQARLQSALKMLEGMK